MVTKTTGSLRYRGLATLILGGALLLPDPAAAQSGDKVRIAGLLALTGGAAVSGLSYRTGMELATKEINTGGGIGGKPVELVFADDQTDTTQAVTEAKRLLLQEKIQVIVGPVLSGQAVAISPTVVEARAVNITSGGTSKITPQDTPNSFSISLSAEVQAQKMADYLANARKVKTMAFLSDAGQLSVDFSDLLKKVLPPSVRVTGVERHQVGQTDMTPQLLTLRRDNPDIIVVAGVNGGDIGHIMKGREDIGWPVPVAGGIVISFLYREAVNAVGAKALEGAAGEAFNATTYCPGDPLGASNYSKFLTKLAAYAPDLVKNVTPLNVASAYDAMYLYKAAIEGSGGSTDGPAIVKWIEQNSSNIKDTVVGHYTPSSTNHFLFGADVLGLGEKFDQPRADGLVPRLGC